MLLREALEVMPCIPDMTSMNLSRALQHGIRKSSNGNLDKEPTLKKAKAHSYVPVVLGGWKGGRGAVEHSHLSQLLSVFPKSVLTSITFHNIHYSLSLVWVGSLSPY